jgi:hypothetical protein
MRASPQSGEEIDNSNTPPATPQSGEEIDNSNTPPASPRSGEEYGPAIRRT